MRSKRQRTKVTQEAEKRRDHSRVQSSQIGTPEAPNFCSQDIDLLLVFQLVVDLRLYLFQDVSTTEPGN